MGPDERRAAAFARWFDEQMCTRIERWRWGTSFVDEDFPTVAGTNFLSLDDPEARMEPDATVAESERALVDAGFAHRRVVVDDLGLAERLGPAFARAGFVAERHRLMVRRRTPAAVPGTLSTDEVPLGEFLRFRDELVDGSAASPVTRAYAEKIDRVVGTRCFLTSIEERPVSGCVAWIHGDDAQLDTVETVPSARGRGAASAAVTAAAEAAHAAGASWIHLYTRADSGPVALYQRLGFVVVGGVTDFVDAPRKRTASRGSGKGQPPTR